MDDLRSRYNQMTELVQFPELARLVGVYTAHFARLELSLWSAYSLVLQMNEDEVMMVLGDVQSFANKLTAIERLFIEKRNHIDGNYLIKKIFERARVINTFRNKLAHGLYLTDSGFTKVYILAFASDPNRQIPVSRLVSEDATNYLS